MPVTQPGLILTLPFIGILNEIETSGEMLIFCLYYEYDVNYEYDMYEVILP